MLWKERNRKREILTKKKYFVVDILNLFLGGLKYDSVFYNILYNHGDEMMLLLLLLTYYQCILKKKKKKNLLSMIQHH